MLRSMTGYGRAQDQWEGRTLIVEVKSVNHRYRDINLRLPRRYNPLESRIKGLVESKYMRGRLELYLNSKDGETGLVEPELNITLADRYREMFVQLQERYCIQDHLSIYHLLSLPDVIIYREKELDQEREWALLEQLISKALLELNEMRAKEGSLLLADMETRIQEMRIRLENIEALSPLVVTQFQERLSRRMTELARGIEIDQVRLAQEVAFFADRCDITEEIVRLKSHMDQCAQVLHQCGPVGKKLEFILQEMHREINTIGSKASDSQIAQHVIDFKADLERLREQVQNIE
jgi:uncharacterized protein (TIGR00255 family)